MNKFSLFFVLFYVAMFGLGSASDLACTPNETFKKDCNTCVCNADGTLAACTLMGCPPNQASDQIDTTEASITESTATEGNLKHESNHESSVVTESTTTEGNFERESNHVCTPNDVKMEDCNRCRCAANGIGWFCTRRACPPHPVQKREVQTEKPSCKPGDSWYDGCNTCGCTESGVVYCTERKCITFPLNIHEADANKVVKTQAVESFNSACKPGDSWNDGCNSCVCSDTGLAACTKRRCFTLKELLPADPQQATVKKRSIQAGSPTCKPGDAWNDGCNNCVCAENGVPACTLRFCFGMPTLKAKRSAPSGNECTPGTTWRNDCNTCFCSETGIAACTLKGCLKQGFGHVSSGSNLRAVSLSEYYDPSFTCTPRETFKLDCNACGCSDDGKKVTWCTKKECVHDENIL